VAGRTMQAVDIGSLAVIGPAPQERHAIDWFAVEDILGLRLPDDFQRFTEAYGRWTDGQGGGLTVRPMAAACSSRVRRGSKSSAACPQRGSCS
jgi:hypothetical protein